MDIIWFSCILLIQAKGIDRPDEESSSPDPHDSDEVDFTKMDQAKGIDRPDDRPDEESPKSPGNIFDKMSR